MAFTITSAPLYGQGGSYTARADRLHLKSITRFGGVGNASNAYNEICVGDCAVTTTGTTDGSVNIAAGHIWLTGASGYGAYYAYNDATVTLGPLAANASGNPRIDLIVARVTDTGAGVPTVAFAILTGTPASVPGVPALTVSSTTIETPLAYVYVPNGFTTTTAIVYTNITDQRTKHGLPNLAVPNTTSTYVPSPVKGDLVLNAATNVWNQYEGAVWKPLEAGPFVCTSSTRPGSAVRFTGQHIFETDTVREYVWNGSAWVCLYATGTYTPTPTGFAVGTGGNATNTASYSFTGGSMFIQGSFVFGTSGTTLPSGQLSATLPSGFTATWTSPLLTPSGPCVMQATSSSGIYYQAIVQLISTTSVRFLPLYTANTYGTFSTPSSTEPFTWANGDSIFWSATIHGTLA